MATFLIILGIVFLVCIGIDAYQIANSTSGKPHTPNIPCPPKSKQVKGVELTRLTMKAIMRWEQMTNKSFSLMDYTDREDIEALFYTMHLGEVKTEYTFEVFRQVLEDERFMNALSSDLGKIMGIAIQFQKQTVPSEISDTEGDPDPVKVSEIISTLIMSGLDAGYALNEMELCDLPMYVEAYEHQKKDRMEESRMWTYLSILPHIDAKKMKNGAKDLITFPWEEEEMLKEAQKAIKEDADRFEEFMNLGKNFIKP